MRTTLDIADETYHHLKARAAMEGTSVKALVHQAVEAFLTTQQRVPHERNVSWPIVKGREPGSLKLTNEQIYDLLDLP